MSTDHKIIRDVVLYEHSTLFDLGADQGASPDDDVWLLTNLTLKELKQMYRRFGEVLDYYDPEGPR